MVIFLIADELFLCLFSFKVLNKAVNTHFPIFFLHFKLKTPNAINATGNSANKLSAGTGFPLGKAGGNG